MIFALHFTSFLYVTFCFFEVLYVAGMISKNSKTNKKKKNSLFLQRLETWLHF